MEKCFYFCHFLHVQLQKNCSEESFSPSPCVLVQCQDLKTISICCPSAQSGSLQIFPVSVKPFYLTIKETKNTGQRVHHVLAEELKISQRIWNYLAFLLFFFTAALSGTLQFESPKFYSKTLYHMY